MKRLFDENLSPRLLSGALHHFPGSDHVRNVGLLGTRDHAIWDYARKHGFAIVSKDADFREISTVEGFPPKVIWLEVGNAGTAAIGELLERQSESIQHFLADEEASLLVLSAPPFAK